MTERKHSHVEAFCLMLYGTRDGSVRETIWNSRDGVTPFMIHTRDGVEMSHLPPWSDDVYAPAHRPKVGDRIFVDLTLERAREHRRAYVERWWTHAGGSGYSMSSGYSSKEEAAEKLARSDMESGGLEPRPDLIEVTADMAKERGWTLTEDEIATASEPGAASFSARALEAKLTAKLREATLAKKLERAAATVSENMGIPIEEARRNLQELVAAVRLKPEGVLRQAVVELERSRLDSIKVPLHDVRDVVIGSAEVAADGTARLNITDRVVADDLRRGNAAVSVGYKVTGDERTADHAQMIAVSTDMSEHQAALGRRPGVMAVDWQVAERCGEVISRSCREARWSVPLRAVDQLAAKRADIAEDIAVLLVALELDISDVAAAAGRKDELWGRLDQASGAGDVVDQRRVELRKLRDSAPPRFSSSVLGMIRELAAHPSTSPHDRAELERMIAKTTK